ncbi:MAG: 1-aminocyclopropane-1-carboxylate deaminase [Alphaproteobacteria bacterium]|jgi:1-aminocyclopropane-1-carboxylate deaminase
MNLDIQLPSPITQLNALFNDSVVFRGDNINKVLSKNNITILCKRDDLIHPIISGNKWRKLCASLAIIKQHHYKHIVSFGGGFSNHLHALSYACAVLNIKFTAVIRGDYSKQLTPTLLDMQQWGSQFHFVSKIEYKKRTDSQYCRSLLRQLKADYSIPEGGSHAECMSGVAAILTEVSSQTTDITHIILPVASGGTLAGLLSSKELPHVKLVGIGVLKGEGYLEGLVESLLGNFGANQDTKQWEIIHEFHHGGYAKASDALRQFVNDVNQHCIHQTSDDAFAIEPVYSGKCFYALKSLIERDYFPSNSKVLILHTGGLQGARRM